MVAGQSTRGSVGGGSAAGDRGVRVIKQQLEKVVGPFTWSPRNGVTHIRLERERLVDEGALLECFGGRAQVLGVRRGILTLRIGKA